MSIAMWQKIQELDRRVSTLEDLYLKRLEEEQPEEPMIPQGIVEPPKRRGWPKGKPRK